MEREGSGGGGCSGEDRVHYSEREPKLMVAVQKGV